ncbi:MAG: exosortase C-terminal domain/associated protein EpsI [Pseudomonadota bacterium]
MSNIRIAIISVLLAVTATVFHFYVGKVADVPVKKPLSIFPREIGNWRWVNESSLDSAVIRKLGLDDYIQYDYVRNRDESLNLYVSYFTRTGSLGKGYHSPKNCMPGAGWDVIDSQPLELKISRSEPATARINMMIMQKGADRQIVFYWYQCRGRIIYSEYMEKIYLVLDSMFKQRSDGAFIRIIAPVTDGRQAEPVEYLKDFTSHLIPVLEEYLPGA